EEHDELYWNVTGNGWVFAIDFASATVVLPQGIAQSDIGTEAYTGREGAKGTDFKANVPSDSRAEFSTTRTLQPREGLTIVVTFPKGFVEEPTASEKAVAFLNNNFGIFIIIAGLIALFAFYFLRWINVGVDPPEGRILPQDEPPADFSPEALRYVCRMGADDKTFSVALINMAVKGYLRIEQEGEKDYFIVRDKGERNLLTEEEQVIADNLLGDRDSIELDQTNYRVIHGTQTRLTISLQEQYKGVYFNRNGWDIFFGVLMSMITCMLALITLVEFQIVWGILAVPVFLAINIVFGFLLKAPTREGRRVLDEIEGFKMYLKGDGVSRFSTEASPEELGNRFEQHLPFAIALGLEGEWGDEFTKALSATSKGPHQHATYYPLWYRGNTWNAAHVGDFSNSLGSSFSNALSSSATVPGSSSGGGGGGSSGGGGGGGGGGGW
ncbi:MAG: DUF2207 domain-containing protein, partial [Candidatus Hydrogenedentota bacterium]